MKIKYIQQKLKCTATKKYTQDFEHEKKKNIKYLMSNFFVVYM